MKTICGINCEECSFKEKCKGCEATCGKPFGGTCVAAEYIKVGGKEAYFEFKTKLRDEINETLSAEGIPGIDTLYELLGSYVNLKYPIPSGQTVKILDDKNVYLGAQIEVADTEICYGVVADTTFILISRYGVNGSNPELVLYKKR